jgi:uncharacterized protein YndB with AHSA1/START domain/DNA-binding transcriptional ArsR family regulator
VNTAALPALADPNRLRMVELLDAAPRSVGEIATRLELRQPQVSKHLQSLERAGLVRMHPLGRRRIYALRRDAFQELERWAAALAVGHPSERTLEHYQAAIDAERALAADPSRGRAARTFSFDRVMPAPAERVWDAWTSADEVRQWWSPAHFEVIECVVDPVVGGTLRVVIGEADGTRYVSTGRYLAVDPPRRLVFELAPLDDAGNPLFSVVQQVTLTRRGGGSRLRIRITATDPVPGAEPAMAGIHLGWEQLLHKLAVHLARREAVPRSSTSKR